jgi:hypothetical protein
MTILIAFAALLALAFAYIGAIRPYLERKGLVKPLPNLDEAFLGRLCAHVRSSLTVAWGYVLQILGSAIELSMVVDKEQVREALAGVGLGEWFGVALFVIGSLTIIARMRTARV